MSILKSTNSGYSYFAPVNWVKKYCKYFVNGKFCDVKIIKHDDESISLTPEPSDDIIRIKLETVTMQTCDDEMREDMVNSGEQPIYIVPFFTTEKGILLYISDFNSECLPSFLTIRNIIGDIVFSNSKINSLKGFGVDCYKNLFWFDNQECYNRFIKNAWMKDRKKVAAKIYKEYT